MLMRCFKYSDARFSPVFAINRLPMALMKEEASGPKDPMVSTPMGTKMDCFSREWYFNLFLSSAFAAAEPAKDDEDDRCDFAKVSTQVTSHNKGLPSLHGISDIPSGRFP